MVGKVGKRWENWPWTEFQEWALLLADNLWMSSVSNDVLITNGWKVYVKSLWVGVWPPTVMAQIAEGSVDEAGCELAPCDEEGVNGD